MNKCSYCGQYVCRANCPNYKEPEIVTYCIQCRESIKEGDRYYVVNDKDYCEYCITDSMRTAEV